MNSMAGVAELTVSADVEAPLLVEQVALFFKQGFLTISEPRINADEIAQCRQSLGQLFKSRAGLKEGRRFNLVSKEDGGDDGSTEQLLSPSMYAPQLRQLSYRKTALAIARQLLGPNACFSGDHAVLKPPGRGGATPWHQDEAFHDPNFDSDQISIWIAIDEATVSNGAMQYIPGSHLLGVLPHRLYNGGKTANTVECIGSFDTSTAQICPLPPGGVVIHHGRTIHGAGRNGTDIARLGYVLCFILPPVRREQPRDFPWLTDLRKDLRQQREAWLYSGGLFLDLIRILRSDRITDKYFFRNWARKKIQQMRDFFKFKK